jgi:hypothetical protein
MINLLARFGGLFFRPNFLSTSDASGLSSGVPERTLSVPHNIFLVIRIDNHAMPVLEAAVCRPCNIVQELVIKRDNRTIIKFAIVLMFGNVIRC